MSFSVNTIFVSSRVSVGHVVEEGRLALLVRKVTLGNQDLQGPQVNRDPKDLKDRMVSQEPLVPQE